MIDEAGRDPVSDLDHEATRQAQRVARLALDTGRTIATAESITGGMISMALARTDRASEWFRGALVAYASAVKHDVLGVPPGPVVRPLAASTMARRTRELLLADVAVAVTGAGGPSTLDGREPGTVFLAVDSADAHRVACLHLPGDPEAVCVATTLAALRALVEELSRPKPGPAATGALRAVSEQAHNAREMSGFGPLSGVARGGRVQ